MKIICLAVLLYVAVFCAEAKSVRSKKEREEGALKRVLAAVKQVKKKEGGKNGGSQQPEDVDPFLAYKQEVEEHCGPEIMRFFSDEPDQVTLGEAADLLSHISDYSEEATKKVNEHADDAESLGYLFDSEENYESHSDLAKQFVSDMDYLHDESFCAFAPIFPMVFRMEVFGFEGVKSCDTMLWRYIQLADEVETMEHTCENWGTVAHELTESFKSDLQCLRDDVNTFHDNVEEAVEELQELHEEGDSSDEMPSHTELMADLSGLGSGMERIGADAEMLYYGIHGVGEILMGLENGGCFAKKEVNNELDLEEKKLQEIMSILKQMK